MKINWNKGNGLVPAIIQDTTTHEVLMLGYMNEESFRITQETGLVTFFSRTRQALWQKGETSGHTLSVIDITLDCDQDALLIRVQPTGPTCHRNTTSCFDQLQGLGAALTPKLDLAINKNHSPYAFLEELTTTLKSRIATHASHTSHLTQANSPSMAKPSYVSQLLRSGIDRVIQKVGEEAIETVIAAKNRDLTALESEAADLVFHLMVLLQAKGSQLENVVQVLKDRSHRKK